MSLITPVRVVVVDDRSDHLFAIANALAATGIPCVWHLYDKETHQLVPPPPATGYTDLRLLVSDLNIRNLAGGELEAASLAGILMSDVLKPILPTSACPYGLVLWSNVQGKAADASKYICERIDHEGMGESRRSAPLSVGYMDKGAFVSTLGAGAPADVAELIAEAAKSVEKVRAQVEEAIADAQLRLLCGWESRASSAATAAINSIFQSAQQHAATTGCSATCALRDVLAKLAIEAAGAKDAKDEPERALDDGLLDLFVDVLRASENSPDYAAIVKASIGEQISGKPPRLEGRVVARLNRDLQVEDTSGKVPKRLIRGLVLGANDASAVAALLGRKTASAVLWPEFFIGIDEFERALEASRGTSEEGRLAGVCERARAEKDDLEKSARLCLVELGADCDHAQRKPRTVRLACAVEVPVRFSTFLFRPENAHALKSEALVKFGPWMGESGEPAYLIVSVARFVVQQEWQLAHGLTALYRLRKPLVDVLLHKYANWSSRPGYVTIT